PSALRAHSAFWSGGQPCPSGETRPVPSPPGRRGRGGTCCPAHPPQGDGGSRRGGSHPGPASRLWGGTHAGHRGPGPPTTHSPLTNPDRFPPVRVSPSPPVRTPLEPLPPPSPTSAPPPCSAP